MRNQQERTEQIEALRGLIERLSAPDLTLAEAEGLRDRLSLLLERANRPAGWDRIASSPAFVPTRERGVGTGTEVWSPEPSMRSAG